MFKKWKCNVDPPFIVSDYFKLRKKKIENILPSFIYNIDVTSLCLDPSRVKIVGEKGVATHKTTSSPEEGKITTTYRIQRKKTCAIDGTKLYCYQKRIDGGWDIRTFLKSVGSKRPIILIYEVIVHIQGIFLLKQPEKIMW